MSVLNEPELDRQDRHLCSLCGRPHWPLAGHCHAGRETTTCADHGWVCREPGEEWERCEHWGP